LLLVLLIIGDGGTGDDTPVKIGSYSEADATFADTDLGKAIKLALKNGAASVIAVDIGAPTLTLVENGLASVESMNVQIVCLANIVETLADTYVSTALTDHVAAAGTDRVAVFMLAKGEDAATMPSAIGGLLAANNSRLFGVAHNSDNDVAAAVAGLLAGVKPWESPLLKGFTGVTQTTQFTKTQIDALETAQINVIVSPIHMSGPVFALGSDYTQGTAAAGINFVDVRRTIDDISYKLKAGLTNPNVIGSLRINKTGLSELSGIVTGILTTAMAAEEIDNFKVDIPVLNALAKAESSRSTAEENLITTARTTRNVDMAVEVEYSGSFHTIDIDLEITV